MSPLPPECEQLLIVGYVLGDLSPAESMLFEELAADNPELMEQVMEVQQALELAYTPPEIAPPPELKDKVLKACVQQETVKETKPEASSQTNFSVVTTEGEQGNVAKKSSFWNKFLAAVALILIVGLGYSNYRFLQMQATKDEIPQVAQRNYTLTGEDLSDSVKATVMVNAAQLEGVLTATNLPPLPPGKVYALWTVVGKDVPYTTDQKGAILTAVFEPNESGNVSQKIVVPQPHFTGEEIAKIAITIEDESAPQAHTGSIFIATENLN